MFKYTPKAQILRDMEVPKTGNFWDKEYKKRIGILKHFNVESSYSVNSIFAQHFSAVCFYSMNQQTQIPVCGFLFPVAMFNEEVI